MRSTSSIFAERLAAAVPLREEGADENAVETRAPRKRTGEDKPDDQPIGIVSYLQAMLAENFGASAQDAQGIAQVDVLLLKPGTHRQRYMLRLQQRSDFPELHDGFIHFADQDVGGHVELFLRFPHCEFAEYAPLKIGEWTIVRRE